MTSRLEPSDLEQPEPDEPREVEAERHNIRQLYREMEALRADRDLRWLARMARDRSSIPQADGPPGARVPGQHMIRRIAPARTRSRSPMAGSTTTEASGMRPEDIVWIFGFGRSAAAGCGR